MEKMVKLDGENNIDTLAGKIAYIFRRYKRGEINFDECERIASELVSKSNEESIRELAEIKAQAREINEQHEQP